MSNNRTSSESAPIGELDHESKNSSLSSSERLYRSSRNSSDDVTSDRDNSSSDIKSECFVNQNKPLKSLVHGHVLPSGWMCNYDSDTDQYKFEFQSENAIMKSSNYGDREIEIGEASSIKDESRITAARPPTADHVVQTSRRPTLNLFECQYGYHFPTSPTSSMISDLAKQVQKSSITEPPAKGRQVGYGKSKFTLVSDEEEQAKRLKNMFPTAIGPIVDQMIRTYHGREGLIKAALISLGYKRATEYNTQQSIAQSPIMLMMLKPSSKKLFDKLVSYFPDKDETLIKDLMFKHKEVEHEIISVLVESGQVLEDGISSKSLILGPKIDKNGVIMKLRYLKYLFPTCEEIELYHLLHCYDLNSQKVIEEVERKGHKRVNIDEVMQNRKSQTQQMRAQQAIVAAKEKAPILDPIEAHRNRTKPTVTSARANNLKDNLKKTFEVHPDELLLKALEAADYNEGLAKKFLEQMEPVDESLYKQRFQFHCEKKPPVILYPCKGIQKDDTSFMSITGNEYVALPKEIVECENALALLKVDACTFTQDDFSPLKFTNARGKKLNLSIGSKFKYLEIKESLKRGAKQSLRIGSNYEQICGDKTRHSSNQRTIGRDKRLAQGRQATKRCGHNPKLVQRTHPFFENSLK